jgi:hypothetical protein
MVAVNQSISQFISLSRNPFTRHFCHMDMEIIKKYNTGYKQYNYNRNSITYKGQMQGKVFVDK